MKKLLVALLLAFALAVPFPAAAQSGAQNVISTSFLNYDLNATTATYGAWSVWKAGPTSSLVTASASTTVTAVSGTPFDLVAVGDQVSFQISGVDTQRFVATKTSGTQITVSGAGITLAAAGQQFQYRNFNVGTAATNGWINVNTWANKNVNISIATMTGTGGIDMTIQCRYGGDGALPFNVYATVFNYSAAGTDIQPIVEPCSSVRVGLNWHTADTAGTDDITVVVTGTTR